MLLVFFALALPATASAGTLHVGVERLPCPRAERMASEIRSAASESMAGQPDLVLLLDAPAPGSLRLRLIGVGVFLTRTVEVRRGDCPELGQTLALLVREWLGARASSPAQPAPPAPVPPPAAAAAIAPDLPAASTETADGGVRLALLAGVFSFLGEAGYSGPSISGMGEWDSSGSLGLALQLGEEGPLHARLGQGRLALSTWRLAALGRIALAGGAGARRLDLLGGPALSLLATRGSGFARSFDPVLVDAGLVGTVRFRQRLVGDWSLLAALQLAVQAQRRQLSVEGSVERMLVLPRARLLLAAGIAWELD